MTCVRTWPRQRSRAPRTIAILLLTTLVSFCAGRTVPTAVTDGPEPANLAELWVEPVDLPTRDLLQGPGGAALAPDSAGSFELVAIDKSGYSAGYDVRDASGVEWSVKLGSEAQPEIASSRLLWAIGYHQPSIYYVANWRMTGAQAGAQPAGRFRRESSDRKVVSEWSWYENPFVATQPFKGLVVANLMLNNWDWKTSNNKIYEVANAGDGPRRRFIVRDLGASLGKTTFPSLLAWTPFRAMAQGTRNDIEGFEAQGFIKRVGEDGVEFHYRGIHDRLLDTITPADVAWVSRLLARLSDAQWRDAFKAGGFPEDQQQRYIAKLKAKVAEGLAVSPAS
jgi:hypothetical protein